MSENLLDQPVRIHKSLLLRHPAVKLWYLCHAADQQGRGRAELTPEELALLKISKSTLYRWLREGREIGLFRIYQFRPNGDLYISLSGLKKACKQMGMKSWGPVTTVPLREIIFGFMRALASAIQSQDLQEKSRYAAGRSLNVLERRCFKIPTVDTILNHTSPKLACGVVPGLVSVGTDKIFVGRSFIPIGASQERICAELNAEPSSCGVCPRTLRNHLKRLGIERRQLVQAKPEYKEIGNAIKWGSAGYKVNKGDDIFFQQEGDRLRLHEPNGKSSASKPGGHLLKPDRFFRYAGTDWIYRCNLYDLDYELTSMKRSRHEYKKMMRHQPKQPVENLALDNSPQTPLSELMPADRAAGASAGNQNKEEKNDNNGIPLISEVDGAGRAVWLAMGEKLKALSHQKWQKRHGL